MTHGQPLPLIPLSDGVGEVIAVGEGVQRFAPGDRVATCFIQDWSGGVLDFSKARSTLGGPRQGVLSELCVLPEHGLVHVPGYLSNEAAAALPIAALTAWTALTKHGELQAGETVLIQGSGGVSLFALQFARVMGARIIASTSDDAKRQRLLQLGADDTVNYIANPAWGREVREKSGGRGVDLVVEVGGAPSLEQSLRALAVGGRIALIGNLAGAQGELNILPILMNQLRIQGVFVGSRDDFEAMNRVLALHQIQPVLDQNFGFQEAPMAFEHMQRRRHFGKITIRF